MGPVDRDSVPGRSANKIFFFIICFLKKSEYKLLVTDLDKLKAKYRYNPATGVFTRNTAWGKQKVGDVAGCISPQGYRYLSFDGKATPAHRLAWLWVNGVWPTADVDHINRDRLDNRIENLRCVTRSVNCHNIAGRASSGEKGVTLTSKGKSWEARICVDSKHIYLGSYASVKEAAAARKGAEIALGLQA